MSSVWQNHTLNFTIIEKHVMTRYVIPFPITHSVDAVSNPSSTRLAVFPVRPCGDVSVFPTENRLNCLICCTEPDGLSTMQKVTKHNVDIPRIPQYKDVSRIQESIPLGYVFVVLGWGRSTP